MADFEASVRWMLLLQKWIEGLDHHTLKKIDGAARYLGDELASWLPLS